MAVIKSKVNGICGIMIDGFLPDLNVLHEIATGMRKTFPLSHNADIYLYRYLRYNNFSGNTLNLYYDKLKLIYLIHECPLYKDRKMLSLSGIESELLCWQMFFSIGKNNYSLEGKSDRLINIKAVAPWSTKYRKCDFNNIKQALVGEYNNIRNINADVHYIQNLVIYDDNNAPCANSNGCLDRYLKEVNFNIKDDDTYLNYKDFYIAWKALINRYINQYAQQ